MEGPSYFGGKGSYFFWGGMASHFSGKIFLVFGRNTIPKYHVKRKEMKKLSMGMSVGEVMKGPPPKKIFPWAPEKLWAALVSSCRNCSVQCTFLTK